MTLQSPTLLSMGVPVKGKTEAGLRREARALQTRQRIVDAGLRLFLAQGYLATTVQDIAQAAGVAPATIYQAFGSKAAVLAHGLDVSVVGDVDPVALLDRDWIRTARDEADLARRVQIVVGHAAGVAARTAALKEVMRDAAASAPEVRDLLREDTTRRQETQQALVGVLLQGADLRDGLTQDHAAATFFALVNSHSFQLIVGHLGWSLERWTNWLIEVIYRDFFDQPHSAAPAGNPGR